jgi:hypothetical protein
MNKPLSASDIAYINQNICRDLVGREVGYCVSSLVPALYAAAVGGAKQIQDYEEELREVCETPKDPWQQCQDEGYRIFKHDDEFYWAESTLADLFVTGGFKAVALADEKYLRCRKFKAGYRICAVDVGSTVSDSVDTADGAWKNYVDNFVRTGPLEHGPFDNEEEAAQDCMAENRIDVEYDEVYEHWIVSSYFGEKLKEHGHTVQDILGLTIWGRGTTGQAIYLDGVIEDIAKGMGILYGQEHSWYDGDEEARAVADYTKPGKWRITTDYGVIKADKTEGKTRLTVQEILGDCTAKSLLKLAKKLETLDKRYAPKPKRK